MWLKYGVALDGNLTSIDEVVRGKTQPALFLLWRLPHSEKGFGERTSRKPTPGKLANPFRSGLKPKHFTRCLSTTISTYRCELKWSSSKGSRLPWRSHTRYPHVKDFSKSGHDQVGNETVGMHATKVTEAASLRRSGARGKSQQ